MVRRDTAEMSRQNFGSCFVTSNVALVRAVSGAKIPTTNIGANYRPATFLRGWSRGGEAVLTLPDVPGSPHLVMVVITGGHYEVTLGVLVERMAEVRDVHLEPHEHLVVAHRCRRRPSRCS